MLFIARKILAILMFLDVKLQTNLIDSQILKKVYLPINMYFGYELIFIDQRIIIADVALVRICRSR